MGQTADEIEMQIEATRDDLKSNFAELKMRVKSATDWRHYYKEHTGMMMVVAFGGGALLSALTRADATTAAGAESGLASSGATKHELHRTFDTIVGALAGTAATRLKGVLGEAVPGFSDHLARERVTRRRIEQLRSGHAR